MADGLGDALAAGTPFNGAWPTPAPPPQQPALPVPSPDPYQYALSGLMGTNAPTGPQFSVLTAPAQAVVGAAQGIPDMLSSMATLPQRSFDVSKRMVDTGEFTPQDAGTMLEAASLPMGTGAIAGVPVRAGEQVLGAGLIRRDPALFHGLSGIKLPRPVSEMQRDLVLREPGPMTIEHSMSPEELQGSVLLPVLGDRMATGGELYKAGGATLQHPVDLPGGPGFMANPKEPGHIWANDELEAEKIAGRLRDAADKTGRPPALIYSAMNPKAVDFQPGMADALSQVLMQGRPSEAAAGVFDPRMRNVWGEGKKPDFPAQPNFPGVRSDELRDWLLADTTSGNARTKFAKLIDLAGTQKLGGFPSVAEVRHSFTQPNMVNAPTYSTGMSVGWADPRGVVSESTHPAFNAGIEGRYAGSLGNLPHDAVFPRISEAYAARPKEPKRWDYLAMRGTPPHYEIADQQWLDRIMPQWLKGAFNR